MKTNIENVNPDMDQKVFDMNVDCDSEEYSQVKFKSFIRSYEIILDGIIEHHEMLKSCLEEMNEHIRMAIEVIGHYSNNIESGQCDNHLHKNVNS